MLYNSTQNAKEVVSAAQAIAQGISKDGGLFVPQEFPKYDENTFKALLKTDYKGRAKNHDDLVGCFSLSAFFRRRASPYG